MKSKKYYGLYLCMIIIVSAMFILGICEVHHVERVLCEMQRDIDTMNVHSNATTQTEYAQTVDFVENEFAKFREFVEKQQEFLIWLIGLVGVALTSTVAFFEIKGRKDISNIIREQYVDRTQEEIADFIGGEKKVKYLMDCIEKEEIAKSRKILFVLHKNENENLRKVYEILKKQKYLVKKDRIGDTVDEDKISCWVEKNDIIIYQVGEKEFTNEIVFYPKISDMCNKKEVYCILYSEQNINRSLYDSGFYVSNANYGLTVIERIVNLLYSV